MRRVVAVCLAFAIVGPVTVGPVAAEARLGVVAAGQVLRLRVSDLPPLSRILIRLDGDDVDLPLAVEGGYLLVSLPETLPGVAHDLVVLQRKPDQDVALQTFTFETPVGKTAYALSGTLEAGALSGRTTDNHVRGDARLSFEIDRGRVTGGVTLSRSIDRATGLATTEITDYFLQRRMALGGDDLTLRIGSQDFEDDLPLFDEASRAGVSLRLSDADQRYDASGFAIRASVWDEARNAFGLGDSADRVIGARGSVMPLAGRGLKLSFAGFSGTVANLPSGNAGANEGFAGGLSLPFAQDRGSFAIGLAQTDWSDGAPQTGQALTAEASFLLTPSGDAQSLTLTARATRVDAGYFSALNPDLIPDESRSELEAVWYAPQFQASLTAARALNDLAADPDLPTDRFREATLDLYYTPQDFTGGFWNGTSLNLTLHREDLRRIETPDGAPEPEDFRFESLGFGIDRFRAETSWALRYSHENLTDLTGAGADESADRIEALYAYTATDDITVNLAARAARINKAGARHEERDVSASLAKQLIPDRLSAEIGVGQLVSDVPSAKPGRYLASELAWEFLPDQELVLSADYGSGAKAHYLNKAGGWVFGLAYRREVGLFQDN